MLGSNKVGPFSSKQEGSFAESTPDGLVNAKGGKGQEKAERGNKEDKR